MLDVLIMGGGPAGAVAGISLARGGACVAIVDAPPPAPRYGETLPPEITPLLKELGLWSAFESLTPVHAAGIVSGWGSGNASEEDFVINPHGTGWRVDR